MTEAIAKIMPLILLILFGNLMYHKQWLDGHTADKLKAGVIQIALPAVLFLTFKNMHIEMDYLLLSSITLIMLCCFYLVGEIINKIFSLNNAIIAFFSTGFSFGLLGVPLFEGVYGIENLSELSVLGIGNEFFIWFIYITLLKQKLGNKPFSVQSMVEFLRSPLIIAIFAGLMINLLNLNVYFEEIAILKGLNRTIEYLAAVTTPIILIIIGYGINIDTKYLSGAFQLVVIKFIIVFGVGYLVKMFVIDQIFDNLSSVFNLAYFTYLILPPPFSLAIFGSDYISNEKVTIINNAIVLNTIICVVLFVFMVILNS